MKKNSICYLNGNFLNLADANISVLDRGFIFGEGIYEVMFAAKDKLPHYELHFARLRNGAKDMQLEIPLSDSELLELIRNVLKRNNYPFSCVYLQLTRGAAERNHFYPSAYEPTVFIMATPISMPRQLKTIKAILMEDVRWQKCNVKSTSLYANTWAKTEAKSQGGEESIFERRGVLTEGATSNLFIVLKDKVITPKENNFILPGVTRDLVLKILDEKEIIYEEIDIPTEMLWQADEVLLTSTTKGILAVENINGNQIGDGKTFALGVQIFESLIEPIST